MNIYIAASFRRVEEANHVAARLRALGMVVTSRWLNGSHQVHGSKAAEAVEGEMPEIPLAEGRLFANDDVEDISKADVLVVLTDRPYSTQSRGGHHVETGLALGMGKLVIIFGPRENAFHCLSQIRQVRTLGDLVEVLLKGEA